MSPVCQCPVIHSSLSNNLPSRTLKASSRTYFFDVKTAQAGSKCLIITESRIKEKQSSQMIMFPQVAQQFIQTLADMVTLLQH
jgi:hypothetical protein